MKVERERKEKRERERKEVTMQKSLVTDMGLGTDRRTAKPAESEASNVVGLHSKGWRQGRPRSIEGSLGSDVLTFVISTSDDCTEQSH